VDMHGSAKKLIW